MSYDVAVIGIGQVAVRRSHDASLAALAVEALHKALEDANCGAIDALYVANMLADELQQQKHLGNLIGSAAGLDGVEALALRAASATGAAALRMAYLAVRSGDVPFAAVVGVEKMRPGDATAALAKSLAPEDRESGQTLLSQNAYLMAQYLDRYKLTAGHFSDFALIAHQNANGNPNALFFDKQVTREDVDRSRVIVPPLRLFDASPICDGAAALVLCRAVDAAAYSDEPVNILASTVATDWIRVEQRANPLALEGVRRSAALAYRYADIMPAAIDFFELHDAFSIMACLALEATGFAVAGEGWRLAADGMLSRDGRLPIATRGGLKARGHPIGATAIYQVCEIVQQLTGRAEANQLPQPRRAMMQSIGGAASTVLTHIFGV